MAQEKFISCVIISDNNKVVGIHETKTITEKSYKDYQTQANKSYKEKLEKEAQEKESVRAEKTKLNKRLDTNSIVVAYLMFRDFVERGKLNTTKEFEDNYKEWLLEGKELDNNKFPQDFVKILERVK